jgi:2-hydroxychromene-2-carboxylate isomerase
LVYLAALAAPTFFVGEEMFWGNDRLEDAVGCAHAKAATGMTALAEPKNSS